jgi:hypothetical protein
MRAKDIIALKRAHLSSSISRVPSPSSVGGDGHLNHLRLPRSTASEQANRPSTLRVRIKGVTTREEKVLRKQKAEEATKIREVEDKLDRKEKPKEYPLEIFKAATPCSSQSHLPLTVHAPHSGQ